MYVCVHVCTWKLEVKPGCSSDAVYLLVRASLTDPGFVNLVRLREASCATSPVLGLQA